MKTVLSQIDPAENASVKRRRSDQANEYETALAVAAVTTEAQ